MTERMAILLDELERRAQDPDDVYPRNAVERFKIEIQKRIDGLIQGGRETIGPQMVMDLEEAV